MIRGPERRRIHEGFTIKGRLAPPRFMPKEAGEGARST